MYQCSNCVVLSRAVTWGAALPPMKKSVASPSVSLAVDRAVRTVRAVRVFVVGQAMFQEKENNNNNNNKTNQTCDPFALPYIGTKTMNVKDQQRNNCCVVCASRRLGQTFTAIHPYRPGRRFGHAAV
jgi:hypothetical protein